MSFLLVSWVLLLHFVFDFMCQNDKMAINKSKSFKWLFAQTSVYSLMAFLVGLPFPLAIGFYLYLFVTHSIIDGITSRITSYLWVKEQRHWFFVTIGFDQWLHYVTIFWFFSKVY